MKRNLFASLLLAAVFALTACGSKDKDKEGGEAAKDETEAPAGEPKATEGDEAKAPDTDQPAAGGEVTAADDAVAQKVLTYFDDLGKAAAASGGDCDKLATNLKEAIGKHDPAAMKAEMDKLDADEAKSKMMEEKYGAQVEAKLGPVMEAVTKCQDNEAVQQAMAEAMPD